jgi:hypothetical protein
LYLNETDQAVDEKLWKVTVNSKTFSLQTFTDANGFGASSIVIGRGTGTAIDYQAFRTGANLERMRIDSSGNVGIGTSSPATKLQVAGVANAVFFENPTTITANYTITTDSNAMAAGPITISSGVTVTIPSGSVWTVI